MENDQLTLLFILKAESINEDQEIYFKQLFDTFADVIGILGEDADEQLVQSACSEIVKYTSEEGKVAGINKAVKKVRTSFCMILESDEFCAVSKLPENISAGTCYRALIDVAQEDPKRNYQLRLFPTPQKNESLFDGFAIPDLSRRFHELGWTLAEEIIPVHKRGKLFSVSDAEAEVESRKSELMSLFWEAILRCEEQKYHSAEQIFRKLLKRKDLFEFNYLASLNGLADALVEQHKLQEAEEVARKSIETNSRQRAPYLTLYKVNNLMGQADEAYHYLNEYLDVLRYASRANLDVSLPISECHFLMAEKTFKQGDYERAFQHYEYFYEFNNGEVSLPILEKLFIYAIELKNYDKSVQYFDDIFGDYIPDNLNENMSARLLESLSLFTDNGWYDFVSKIYEELVENNPEDNELINGWITTLLKNKEIEKAQQLIADKKAS